MKRKPIYNAVKAATTMLALSAASSVVAQDEVLEELTVTGTNIPRAISDAPQPITVIDSLDIQLSGINNTADLLRRTAYNSFGSFRERSGSSFGGVATLDLRGLGADRTAVLVNGRRIAGSPLTGGSTVDLNTIPVAAIERMEILKDSASAIYGADAIGGVISVVLKDDFEGFSISGGVERPTREGAESENFSVLWGKTHDRGNIMAGVEYYSRDAISDADREYSRARLDGPNFANTEGVSVGGNTGFLPSFPSGPFALGSCDTSVYAGVFTDPFGLGGDGCGFAYANISLQTGNIERKSAFLSSNFEITEDLTWYADLRYTNNETLGRYAPAVGFFNFSADSPFNTIGQSFDAFHRFVGHGNRDDSVDFDETVISTGLKGEFENGIGYDLWFQYYDNSGVELGNTYIQASVLEAEVAAGNYNVLDPLSQDPIHLGAVERSGVQLSRDLKSEDISLGVTFNGESFEMGGGNTGWAFGLEWGDQDYTDIYDEFRESLDVLGSAGNSAAGDRSRWAAFGEFRMPIADNFEVTLAGRYDDFDGFGDEFSPQIAARFSPNDNLTLRASFGEGFRAPSLIELTQSLAESFDDLTDQVFCAAQGIAPGACPTFQVQNFSGGNLQLEAEESENFNIGAVLDLGNFSGSIDYYDVSLENAVTELSLDQINDREARGDLPPGVIVNRGPALAGGVGGVVDIINPLSNGASVETSGIDIGLNYAFETGLGDVDLNLTWVHILEYNEQTTEDSPVDELIGTENGDTAYPENRATTSFRLSRENLTFTWAMQYIDSFRNVSDTDEYDSWLGHDLTVNWVDAFGVAGLSLTAGVQNVTDEGPSIDPNPAAGYNDSVVLETYSVAGRIPFINFKYDIEN